MNKHLLFTSLVVVLLAVVGVTQVSNVQAACNPNALTKTNYGMSGVAVTQLQTCLMEAGYSIPAGATGYYGSQTRAAVQSFYAKELALADWDGNSVGPQGRAKLGASARVPTPPTPEPPTEVSSSVCTNNALAGATFGAANAQVTQLQTCLMEAGYSIPAGATGYYGSQTRAAVQAFYRATLGLVDWHGNFVGPQGRSKLSTSVQTPRTVVTGSAKKYVRVGSEAELRKYMEAQGMNTFSGDRMMLVGANVDDSMGIAVPTVATVAEGDSAESAKRVSETNVQVAGIDEPDIVKTDGRSIFFSQAGRYYPRPMPITTEPVQMGMPDVDDEVTREVVPGTVVVDAFPLDNLGIASETIEERGDLLLEKESNTLVVLAYPKVVAYDVSNPDKPEKTWSYDLGDGTSVYTARLTGDTLYLVTVTNLRSSRPCPVMPLVSTSRRGVSISCGDILVPERIEPVHQLYTVLSLDVETGSVDAQTSIAKGGWNTVVAMFEDNLYLVSPSLTAQVDALLDILVDSIEPFMPSAVMAKVHTIKGYEISTQGKIEEIGILVENELESLSADERLRVTNEIENNTATEMKKRIRDMDRSRIVRIALPSLAVAASSDIPGKLLNQFSIDEYDGNVRVAVTVSGGWRTENVNDVYVLNQNLDIVGSVKDLGIGERIYSARFMGDVAYLVTFRQIDPFYVLDLSVPSAPKLTGELKIPGYSAYLEPLSNDLVLGVGREGSGVKLSVFDVGNPARPIEKSKYQLSEGWTEVESNHHAFLRDALHEVFFIPGGQGGYIFSYGDGDLTLKKTLAGYQVKRALYIDDYMYVISEDKIRVLNENTWEQEAELSLE